MSVLAAAAGARTRRKPRAQYGADGVQGDWVNAGYGADRGYLIAAWTASDAAGALNALNDVTVAYTGSSHFRWAESTSEVRAIEAPDESFRRASTFYSGNNVGNDFTLTLTFGAAYQGMLRIYCLDWDDNGRRQTVEVNDGRGIRSVSLDQSYAQGAWVHVPITVSAGGAVTVKATNLATTGVTNAVISGLWIG